MERFYGWQVFKLYPAAEQCWGNTIPMILETPSKDCFTDRVNGEKQRSLASGGFVKQTLKSSVVKELPKTTATIKVLFEYQVSMIPCYQYPHINDTQNQVSTIR
jgi:hypothetical protein